MKTLFLSYPYEIAFDLSDSFFLYIKKLVAKRQKENLRLTTNGYGH